MQETLNAAAAWPSTDASADAAAGQADGPGQRLRRAREARGIATGQIAQELRLRPAIIDAVERDDYASLPGAVFVGGYLRGYARLLGLDPEPLLATFRERHPDAEAPPPRATPRFAPGDDTDGRGGGLLVPLVSALVVLALLAGVYLWWQNGSPMPASLVPSPTPDVLAPLPGAGAAQETVLARPDPSQTPGPDASLTDGSAPGPPGADAELTMAPEPGLELDADIATGIIATPPGGGRIDGPDDEPDEPSVLTGSPILSASPATASATGEPAPAAGAETGQAIPNEVVLAFSGPSWVDVRDANGESQLFGELASGDRRALGGEPPYSLIIGNASAVTLTIGGAPFDMNAIARGNVARFKLDPVAVTGRDDATTAPADGAN